MDEPWGHYAKWNKSDRERQIFHLYVECKTKSQTHRYREQIGGCQRWGVADEMGESGQKIQTSSYKINKSWGCNI